MLNPNSINIVTCADSNYLQHATIMLLSLFDHIGDCVSCNVFLYYAQDCGQIELGKASTSIERFRPRNVRTEFVPIPDGIRPDLGVKKPYLNTGIYDKLVIFDLLPDEISRVLFLDADIVLLSDVAEIYAVDLEGFPIAAVEDYYQKFSPELKRVLSLPTDHSYFNSGVMIIDLSQFREKNYAATAIEFLEEHCDITVCYDQDGLNYALQGNWKSLPKAWNPRPYNEIMNRTGYVDIVLRDDFYRRGLAKLVHFSGADKPWYYLSNHPMNRHYLKYLKRSEFRDYEYPDKSISNFILKYMASIRAILGYFKRRFF